MVFERLQRCNCALNVFVAREHDDSCIFAWGAGIGFRAAYLEDGVEVDFWARDVEVVLVQEYFEEEAEGEGAQDAKFGGAPLSLGDGGTEHTPVYVYLALSITTACLAALEREGVRRHIYHPSGCVHLFKPPAPYERYVWGKDIRRRVSTTVYPIRATFQRLWTDGEISRPPDCASVPFYR